MHRYIFLFQAFSNGFAPAGPGQQPGVLGDVGVIGESGTKPWIPFWPPPTADPTATFGLGGPIDNRQGIWQFSLKCMCQINLQTPVQNFISKSFRGLVDQSKTIKILVLFTAGQLHQFQRRNCCGDKI